MDHQKNGQKYAIFMDRMRLYNKESSPTLPIQSSNFNNFSSGDPHSADNPFHSLVHPSKSPRFARADKIDVKDIRGAQSTTNQKAKQYQMRDHINVSDIVEEGRFYKREQVINKNDSLLTDEILGKKKQYVKDHSPLDPKYVVSTKSKRMIIIGDIEGGKPKQFVKPQPRKDTKRYLRVDDIEGASPKEKQTVIPESLLPGLHPLF